MMDDRTGGRHEPTVAREDAGGAAPSEDEESDGDFEFPFVSRDPAPADELFAGGRIQAFYPVFGRVLDDAAPVTEPPRAPLGRLFRLEKARTSSVASTSSSSSSSAGGDLDAASPDTYCLWTPGGSSPSRPPRKSGSTGSSMARWRRIGDFVVGRSHSDGTEKFLFLSAPPSPARDHASSSPKAKKQQTRGSKAAAAGATTVDTVAAGRRMSYGGANAGSPGSRRTFLPYRQDLVGLFSNVQGLRRGHRHPF